MKKQRFIILCALLGVLIASGVLADDVPRPSPVNTSLSNTTIGGYVDSTTGGQVQPPTRLEHGGWWRTLMLWFGFHAGY